MSPQPRAEPRRMSLADIMVAVAGCAVGYSLQPFLLEWVHAHDFYAAGSFTYESLFFTARRPLMILGFAIAAAIVVRTARYGRMPRAAEWPALVMAADLVSTAVLDRAYALTLTGRPASRTWRPDHWPWAAACSLLALPGLIVLMALRRQIPPCVRTLGFASLTILWLCGPSHVYFKQISGAPPQPVGSAATWAFQLRWSEWVERGRWPELLAFGIGIAAALEDGTRPGQRACAWTEWTSLGIGLILALCWWLDRISLTDPTNPARLANLVVRGLWLGGVGMISWLMLRGCDAVRERLMPGARSPVSKRLNK